MNRFAATLLFLLFFHCNHALSFDGERKGVVLGCGFGLVPEARWSLQGEKDGAAGWCDQLVLGYGFNDKNMVALEINLTDYKPGKAGYSYIQGIVAPVWYHRFRPQSRSVFTAIGIGLYRIVRAPGIYIRINMPELIVPIRATGIGYLVGLGREFSDHFQIGLYVTGGRTREDNDYSHTGNQWGHTSIEIMAAAFAY